MPLCCQLYNRFLSWIKDEISRVGKLTTLPASKYSPNLLMPITRNAVMKSLVKYWQTRFQISLTTRVRPLLWPTRTPVTRTHLTPVPLGILPPLLLQPVLQSQLLPLHLSSGKIIGSLRKRDSITWTMICVSSMTNLAILPPTV